MPTDTAPNGDQDRITDSAACRFRASQPPWPSQMCAVCGEWREDHEVAGITPDSARTVRRD